MMRIRKTHLIVAVLAVALMVPAVALAGNPFTDVPDEKFYADPVDWAYNNDLTTGSPAGSDTFKPEDAVTRGENITFSYRYDQNIVQPALADLAAADPQVHWIWFEPDGTKRAGSDGVTSTRGAEGWYTVNFGGKDITNCSWSAVYRSPAEFLPAGLTDVMIALQQGFDFTSTPFTTIVDQIDIYVFDNAEASQDADIQLQVIC
jgi:hypothetical protein